jgi:glycerol-3-phosphate dehydrogenase (NAD(P)+)
VVPALFSGCPVEIDGVVIAVPSASVRRNLELIPHLRRIPLLSAAKGIERGTLLRMSEVAVDTGWRISEVCVLSGPNLAREILAGKPAATVIAGPTVEAGRWQEAFHSRSFRVYQSDDVCGVEIGGALKNVVAIAAGVSIGLDAGVNAMAALMTRGLAEIARLGVVLGAEPATFLGLAGLGDLVATCGSPLSRNRRLGEFLARGQTLEASRAAIGETVEGAATAPLAVELGRSRGVEMPIAEAVAAILSGFSTVEAATEQLLGRMPRRETT